MRNVPIKAALSPENRYTPYLLFYVKLEGRETHTDKAHKASQKPTRAAGKTSCKACHPSHGTGEAPTIATESHRGTYKQKRKQERGQQHE